MAKRYDASGNLIEDPLNPSYAQAGAGATVDDPFALSYQGASAPKTTTPTSSLDGSLSYTSPTAAPTPATKPTGAVAPGTYQTEAGGTTTQDQPAPPLDDTTPPPPPAAPPAAPPTAPANGPQQPTQGADGSWNWQPNAPVPGAPGYHYNQYGGLELDTTPGWTSSGPMTAPIPGWNAPPAGSNTSSGTEDYSGLWTSSNKNPQAFVQALIAKLGLVAKQTNKTSLQKIVDALNAVSGGGWKLSDPHFSTPGGPGEYKGLVDPSGQFIKLISGSDTWEWLVGGDSPSGTSGGTGYAPGIGPGTYGTPYTPGSYDFSSPLDTARQATALDLLASPGGYSQQAIDTMKARSKDEAAQQQQADDANLVRQSYATGTQDSNFVASERNARRTALDSAVIAGNRAVDLTAAEKQAQDRRANAQLASQIASELFGNKLSAAQFQEAIKQAATQLGMSEQDVMLRYQQLAQQDRQFGASYGLSAEQLRWQEDMDAWRRYMETQNPGGGG